MDQTRSSRRRRLLTLSILCTCSLGVGCSPQDSQAVLDPPVDRVLQAINPMPDGDVTINAGTNVAVNRGSQLFNSAVKGSNLIDISPAGAVAANLSAGDLILIIQHQGATIKTADDATFGEVTSLNGAGNYELATVASVNNATGIVTINGSCGGLRNSYDALSSQLYRIPQYRNLTVQPAPGAGMLPGRIIPNAQWNSRAGGIIAIKAQTINLDGEIDASAAGFRGGERDGASAGTDVSSYRTTNAGEGSRKGEGIAGYDSDAFGGRYGRGAAANGGGGANSFDSGGGGGANGGSLALWNGFGVMDDSTADFKTAWALDPFVIANGGKLTTSSGGGHAAYGFSTQQADPLVNGPGDAAWGPANARRLDRGGFGGRPVPNNPANRLFFGGGGGSGEQNNNGAGSGGRGGGIVFLIADEIKGAGRVLANGQNGQDGIANVGDGAGGAGAGGTIVIGAPKLSGVTVEAKGGSGGNAPYLQAAAPNALFGSGGGGGGGYVALSPGSNVQPVVSGGTPGTIAAPFVSKFPQNGATIGGAGDVVRNVGTQAAILPNCQPADLSVSISDGLNAAQSGSTLTYQLQVVNVGPFDVTSAKVASVFTGLTGLNVTWTCTATPATPGQSAKCTQSGTGDVADSIDLAAGAFATYTITVTNPQGPGTIVATASALPNPAVNDPNLANNTSVDRTRIGDVTDVAVSIAATPKPVAPDSPWTVTVTAENKGPVTATNVTVRFDVPEGAVLSQEPSGAGWTCTRAEDLYTCVRPSLAANESAPLTYVFTTPQAGTGFVSSAQVTSDAIDTTPDNDQATVDTRLEGSNSDGMKRVLAGGGFACSALPGAASGSASALTLLGLSALGLLRRRRRS